MGHYWHVVNLDKKEWINPSKLNGGLKLNGMLWEPSRLPHALVILLADMRAGAARSGDFMAGLDDPGYREVAERTIGRWAGDRVMLVGDEGHNNHLFFYCSSGDEEKWFEKERFTDISHDVQKVIEQEMGGEFVGHENCPNVCFWKEKSTREKAM